MPKLVSHSRLLIIRIFKGNRKEQQSAPKKSSGYREKNYMENDLKKCNENCFELVGGYKGFELPGVDCILNILGAQTHFQFTILRRESQ